MSLARAFTSKRSRPDVSTGTPQRAISTRHYPGKPVLRSQISAPIELLSTTNMLSFNAPDIHRSPSSSVGSIEESDVSPHPSISSAATSVEASPVDSYPGSPDSKHLSTQFRLGPSEPVATVPAIPGASSFTASHDSMSSTDAPAIPKRAPTRNKASHQALAHQPSLRPPTRFPAARDVGESSSFAHPFGRELQQVNEVAAEFGVRSVLLEDEERLLRENGLQKFAAQDYIAEIEGLFGSVFEDRLPLMGPAWI